MTYVIPKPKVTNQIIRNHGIAQEGHHMAVWHSPPRDNTGSYDNALGLLCYQHTNVVAIKCHTILHRSYEYMYVHRCTREGDLGIMAF